MDRRGEGELAVMANACAGVERMESIQMSMAKGPVRELHAPSDLVPVASAGGLQPPLTLDSLPSSFTTGETGLLRGFFFGMDKLI